MAAGQELVREYIDDGYTRTLLTRPGLEQLRSDLKMDVFEVVHFLAAISAVFSATRSSASASTLGMFCTDGQARWPAIAERGSVASPGSAACRG
jgi:hypothetical protein